MPQDDWLAEGLDHIWLPYAQMKTAARPRAAVATSGSRIRLADGTELIDGVASWWSAIHGYNHPHILGAMRRQIDTMPHIMLGGLAHETAYRLAARLAAITPGALTRVFFTESGSVAVEVAMKIAIQYWRNRYGEQRTKFISFRGGYHGDTFAAMSICDPEEGMHALFKGALAEQFVVDPPRDDKSENAIAQILEIHKDVAAIIIEPLLQGAGGMQIHDAECLKRLRRLCDAYGVLLIFDEIFTGFGRTGAMFAADRAGVEPDIMTVGKALTGGVTPLAAAIAGAHVYAAFHDDDGGKALMHGPTYTGHPVACAAAMASLDLFENEPRLAQVKAIEKELQAAFEPLRDIKGVRDVRVIGAVGAVELEKPFDVEAARKAFIAEGVFIRPLGRVIYLSPAYTIAQNDLLRLTDAIAQRASALCAQTDGVGR
jgi:adenosylmethionine-8-amino-7-oxononanoate aminotransferase